MKFPQYPYDRPVTREEYEAGYELTKEEYKKAWQEISKLIMSHNIGYKEVEEGGRTYIKFLKPTPPPTLDEYIALQEFTRGSAITFAGSII